MSNYILSEDEEDVLQELMNIAYGSATAVIAEMLEAFASLSIPNIQVIQVAELLKTFEELKSTSYFFSSQAFNGEFNGESAFFINEESANNLAKHLELENKDDLDDAILELTNVLTSSLTTKLAQELETEVGFSLPSISKVPLNEINNVQTFKIYSKVIVIDTELNFQDQKINGKIFILTKDESIQWLKIKLNNILDNLM
ncbi:chemotaxis protein CheX [Sulfurimonas autotrophica]|uniref:CheC, inhibitor of MCP methylation n=1 Tax=Sulfurimonas autotrophica (strain ATCC BAA-671 / DSM 16294 / JCM 11897 / OK10) TaxID=563040 RepID=E0USB0_SULAO|nr:chemotaxis protein CheX [Sulfurimonas autotrophica]ADN10203.1 CheC, inhibitor of MCP methylation [Sulfurimonas autotrophica DSM 16294]